MLSGGKHNVPAVKPLIKKANKSNIKYRVMQYLNEKLNNKPVIKWLSKSALSFITLHRSRALGLNQALNHTGTTAQSNTSRKANETAFNTSA